MHYPYQAFLNGTGLTVKFFRIHWYTTALNRSIVKWASNYPKLLKYSFNVGVWVSVITLPIVFLVYFLWTFFQINETIEEQPKHNIGFEIMLPGVNLPLDEIGYYIGALALCSVFHEMGHAFSAVLEDVPVTGFGFYIFLVFPLAYTELSTDQLNAAKIWSKLRVLAAGVWHNIILALLAYLIFSVLGIVFMPLYSTNTAVIVTQVKKDSPLLGVRGIAVNDVITKINKCDVRNMDNWFDCLLETIKRPPGYCISSDFVLNHDESVPVYHSMNEGLIECCDRRNLKNVCFEYLPETDYSVLELPQHVCLNARTAIEQSLGYCQYSSKECKDSFCIKPLLNNYTTVIQITRQASGKKDVLYIGHPADITKSVKVSAYVPKTRWFGASFADGISLFLKYTIVFSVGLAIVNIIPCYGFDGQHIVSAVIHHVFLGIVPERSKRDLVIFIIIFASSVIFFGGVLRTMYTTFAQYPL